MSEQISIREVCDIFKKYRLDIKDPEVLKWYYRLKAKDEQTILNLQQYLNRKVFYPKKSSNTLRTEKSSPETEHKEEQ